MTWADDMQTICANSGGVLEVSVVGPEEWAPLVAASFAGDATATLILGAVADTITRVACAPQRRCGVVLPARPDPTGGVGVAVCDRCARTATEAMPLVMEALRRIWPDMRTVQLGQHAGGHA